MIGKRVRQKTIIQQKIRTTSLSGVSRPSAFSHSFFFVTINNTSSATRAIIAPNTASIYIENTTQASITVTYSAASATSSTFLIILDGYLHIEPISDGEEEGAVLDVIMVLRVIKLSQSKHVARIEYDVLVFV